MKIPRFETPKFTLRELHLIPYHSIESPGSPRTQTLIPDLRTAFQLQFTASRLRSIDQSLASPDVSVAITFIAGEGCRQHLGLSPHREYFIINDHLYERLTMRDIGKRGSTGLKRVIDGRLTYWVLLVEPSNHADLMDAIKTYVQRIR